VQNGSPHTHSRSSMGKRRIHCKSTRQKSNAAERVRILRLDCDSKLFQSRDAVWHQAFAAGFIDRHLRAIGDDDTKAPLPRSDRRRQSRRTATNHEYIS